MVLDWGRPNAYLEDWLRLADEYVDIGKVAIGTGRFYPESYLREKVEIYRRHGVHPCPGGNFLEHAAAKGKAEEFLKAAADLGFEHVEVSNNRGLLPRAAIKGLIGKARDHGFRVFGEVGSEVERTTVADMIRDIHDCLESGVEKVYVEATDLIENGQFDLGRARHLASEVPLERLIFELAGWWVKGVDMFEVHRTMIRLVEQFGPSVNVGNVDLDDVLLLECVRRDLE
jgi:phosphosulfolactate synthase